MTTNKKYNIINLSKERKKKREENNMRKVVYVVGGQEITSYEKAREIQPSGQLQIKLEEIKEEVKANPETLAKIQAYFAKRRTEKAVASN